MDNTTYYQRNREIILNRAKISKKIFTMKIIKKD